MMSWDWDHLTRNLDQPPPVTRWTPSEVGIALLFAALLAGVVLLAYFTSSPR